MTGVGEQTADTTLDVIGDLFERAKAQDEFEFVCTLLRIRGAEDPGWDTLEESWALINQVVGLADGPVVPACRLRLYLFLYCHVTEMDDLYHLIGNLVRVCLGDRYTLSPFRAGMYGAATDATGPSQKAEHIAEWCAEAGVPAVAALLDEFLESRIRNAFFHSDYVLFDGEMRIKRGRGVVIDGVETHRVSLEWLTPKMELGINTLLILVDVLRRHTASYQEPKRIRGRFAPDGGWADLELIVQPGYGVTGFRSVT